MPIAETRWVWTRACRRRVPCQQHSPPRTTRRRDAAGAPAEGATGRDRAAPSSPARERKVRGLQVSGSFRRGKRSPVRGCAPSPTRPSRRMTSRRDRTGEWIRSPAPRRWAYSLIVSSRASGGIQMIGRISRTRFWAVKNRSSAPIPGKTKSGRVTSPS